MPGIKQYISGIHKLPARLKDSIEQKLNISNMKLQMNKNNQRLLTISLLLVASCFFSYAQDIEKTKNNWLKLGLDYGLSYTNPTEINNQIGSWLTSATPVVDYNFWKGIHLGFAGNAYASITILKLLEIRPQYGFSYAPYFMLTEEAKTLNVNIIYESLGLSSSIHLGRFEFGGGVDKYYSRINWKDDSFNFSDCWKGNTIGFNAFIGIDRNRSKHKGVTYTLLYRNATVNQLINENNHIVKNAKDNKDVALNLSGLELKIGFYFGL
jgi:hypothetical protein